jgi:hypothetical protein
LLFPCGVADKAMPGHVAASTVTFSPTGPLGTAAGLKVKGGHHDNCYIPFFALGLASLALIVATKLKDRSARTSINRDDAPPSIPLAAAAKR